jgi:hypothetical protein
MTIALPGRQSITIDTARRLVDVTIVGVLNGDQSLAAMMELRGAVQSLGPMVGSHVTLYDLTQSGPVPQAAVEMIRGGFANPVYRKLWARRVAFAATSPLLRRQIERVREARPDIAIFETREAALGWLLAGD